MKIAALPLVLLALAAATPAIAAVTPCEDMLKTAREARDGAKLDDATAKSVDALVQKGIDRCNADDDKRADDFFAEALKLMGN